MKRFGVRVTVAAMALVLTAGIALAEANTVQKKKKLGFFASLFGTSSTRRTQVRQQKPLFGKNWWNRSEGDVQIIRAPNSAYAARLKNIPDSANEDPEQGGEGYGMGNLTYVADKLVPLDGNVFKEERPPGTFEAAIYDALSAKDLGFRVLPVTRAAMIDYYRAQGFRPVWIEDGKLAPRAGEVLKLLAAADEEGLMPANYLPPTLASFDDTVGLTATDPQALARLDLGLTAMTLKYAHDASGGQFDPRRLSRYNDITPERVMAGTALKVLAWSPYPESFLRGLEPKLPAYGAMKTALAQLRKETEGQTVVPIATGKRVKPGQSDERIAAVRERLTELGLETAAISEDSDPTLLDPALSVALKDFQKVAGIKVSGNLENATVDAMNNRGGESDIRRLVDNMERLRWLPKNLGQRHVFVNQPAFQVRVMDGPSEVWQSRVIVGKPNLQTSVFNDEIEMVVFNPSWGVPPSIIANEYLPKLRRDPGYLDRIGFKVTTASGQKIASSNIDWNAYGRKVPFSIQQPPGRKNALGELKFLFPNAHNIYMHDTPNRELFEEDARAFSHGCVRVQNPREFATVLLGWDRAKVDADTDSKQSHTVRLPRAVPIHIAYFTAWPDESGKIVYFDDIYGRDRTMENALTATAVAQR